MSRQPGPQSIKILINHWRWLSANGYKKEASSCKRQAASFKHQAASAKLDKPQASSYYRIIKEN
tara:strand:+ start:315 stop:506 length:192 start_codon:yes stop_codon:yes gene_type:complete